MRSKTLILISVLCIFMIGCSSTNSKANEEVMDSQIESKTIDEAKKIDEELYIVINTIGEKKFDEKVELKPEINGTINKGIKYRWTLEKSSDQEKTPIDGLVSENEPTEELINDGEGITFAVFSEVSYIPGAYNERTLKLEILDEKSDSVLAEDSVKIKNYEGRYIIDSSFNEKLGDKILKSPKAKLYGEVIDRLWEMDSALNSGVNYIDVDTSTFQGLNEDDKQQLFKYLEKQYDVKVLDMTMDGLEKAGYIKELSFKNGVVFKINEYTENTSDKICFTGSKWVSGCGAIGFIVDVELRNDLWKIIECNMTWIS